MRAETAHARARRRGEDDGADRSWTTLHQRCRTPFDSREIEKRSSIHDPSTPEIEGPRTDLGQSRGDPRASALADLLSWLLSPSAVVMPRRGSRGAGRRARGSL